MKTSTHHRVVRTFLIKARMPAQFWYDAAQTTFYVINRLPTPLLNGISPFEKLFFKRPNYSFLWVFGSQCFPNITATTQKKL